MHLNAKLSAAGTVVLLHSPFTSSLLPQILVKAAQSFGVVMGFSKGTHTWHFSYTQTGLCC